MKRMHQYYILGNRTFFIYEEAMQHCELFQLSYDEIIIKN